MEHMIVLRIKLMSVSITALLMYCTCMVSRFASKTLFLPGTCTVYI